MLVLVSYDSRRILDQECFFLISSTATSKSFCVSSPNTSELVRASYDQLVNCVHASITIDVLRSQPHAKICASAQNHADIAADGAFHSVVQKTKKPKHQNKPCSRLGYSPLSERDIAWYTRRSESDYINVSVSDRRHIQKKQTQNAKRLTVGNTTKRQKTR